MLDRNSVYPPSVDMHTQCEQDQFHPSGGGVTPRSFFLPSSLGKGPCRPRLQEAEAVAAASTLEVGKPGLCLVNCVALDQIPTSLSLFPHHAFPQNQDLRSNGDSGMDVPVPCWVPIGTDTLLVPLSNNLGGSNTDLLLMGFRASNVHSFIHLFVRSFNECCFVPGPVLSLTFDEPILLYN